MFFYWAWVEVYLCMSNKMAIVTVIIFFIEIMAITYGMHTKGRYFLAS